MPAPIDVKSVNWATHRYHANWDGNQGASSRTLASGASATGDPRMVNVRIHEPLNPFIDNLPPPPYPFPGVDLARAREGKAIFKAKCASCHTPRNQTIYPASQLGVDAEPHDGEHERLALRAGGAGDGGVHAFTASTTRASRAPTGACRQGDWQARLDEYFRDTPRRVAEGTNGYKADMLHGIWAQAPYLHNGSVPTIGQLMCPDTRPRRFLRGNLHYDEGLVGFEWAESTGGALRSPRHHPDQGVRHHGAGQSQHRPHLRCRTCVPTPRGLDPTTDRKEIEARLLRSPVGALLAYLKTL